MKLAILIIILILIVLTWIVNAFIAINVTSSITKEIRKNGNQDQLIDCYYYHHPGLVSTWFGFKYWVFPFKY